FSSISTDFVSSARRAVRLVGTRGNFEPVKSLVAAILDVDGYVDWRNALVSFVEDLSLVVVTDRTANYDSGLPAVRTFRFIHADQDGTTRLRVCERYDVFGFKSRKRPLEIDLEPLFSGQ